MLNSLYFHSWLNMWSDNETPVDFLGFQHLVAAVVNIVQQDRLLPATIGVYGDWGSGKSSLLRMVGEAMAQDSSALVLTFNGWLFEGYEDAKIALMGTILDEIKKRRTITGKAKELFEKQINRLNWFRICARRQVWACLRSRRSGWGRACRNCGRRGTRRPCRRQSQGFRSRADSEFLRGGRR